MDIYRSEILVFVRERRWKCGYIIDDVVRYRCGAFNNITVQENCDKI